MKKTYGETETETETGQQIIALAATFCPARIAQV
jgi:hypothetical protein